ncbi:RDD family protein [Streptomyces sp. NPDC096176]|uniref:RDD family protein n=1 Tax=Streptomyces sp. NPDC096176 TaxID=3366079 RepID=UPI00381406F4
MSNDQPPPEDDPFRKKAQEPQEPQGPREPGGPTPPPSGGPTHGGGSPYDSPPGGSGGTGGPYGAGGAGGAGGPYGGAGGQPPPYDGGAFGGPYGGADPLAGMPPLADFGKRVLARLIDMIIVFVPLFLISLIFGGLGVATGGDDWDEITDRVNTGEQWLWSLISLVVYVGYDTIMTKMGGQTVGKKIMKLRVAMLNDGRAPDTGSSLLRAVVLWVPALVCCFCVWWLVILITVFTNKPYRQGLHDKAAKTVVVSAA